MRIVLPLLPIVRNWTGPELYSWQRCWFYLYRFGHDRFIDRVLSIEFGMIMDRNKQGPMQKMENNKKCELCLEGGLCDETTAGIAAHRVTIDDRSNAVFFGVAGKKSAYVCDECLRAGPWEHDGINPEDGSEHLYEDTVESL